MNEQEKLLKTLKSPEFKEHLLGSKTINDDFLKSIMTESSFAKLSATKKKSITTNLKEYKYSLIDKKNNPMPILEKIGRGVAATVLSPLYLESALLAIEIDALAAFPIAIKKALNKDNSSPKRKATLEEKIPEKQLPANRWMKRKATEFLKPKSVANHHRRKDITNSLLNSEATGIHTPLKTPTTKKPLNTGRSK